MYGAEYAAREGNILAPRANRKVPGKNEKPLHLAMQGPCLLRALVRFWSVVDRDRACCCAWVKVSIGIVPRAYIVYANRKSVNADSGR
jgi:hypothetical protein